MKTYSAHFDSFETFVNNPNFTEWINSDKFVCYKDGIYGNSRSYKNYLSSIENNPDPKGMVSDFLRTKEQLKAEARATTTVYDVSGDFVDVDRYLSGEPECMIDFREDVSIKFIDVVIQLGRPAVTISDTVKEYYSVILNIIDELENSGFRCKITIETASCEDKNREITKRASVIIDFKNYEDPIDYKTFALLALDNDFFTKMYLSYVDCFMNYIKGTKTENIDSFIARSIKERQSESSIYFPSLYQKRNQGFGAYYFREAPTQKELIKDIGIDFLFPGVE